MAERRALIFLGPSLPDARPSQPCIEYAPPARRGDLIAAAKSGYAVIGLIDGVFHQALAVTPAEVREAASSATLIGGASMGALRACECPDHMRGVGQVWADFVSRRLTADDEVAVTFLPETYALMACPLVQVREVARLARVRYPHLEASLAIFVDRVRSLPFHERILERIRKESAELETRGVLWGDLEAWLIEPSFDLKRRDALAVIDAVVQATTTPRP